MPDNAQKTPLAASLDRFWEQKGASHDALQGRFAPASVVSVDETQTIVTVKIEILDDTITFPYIVCGLVGPEYIRFPIRQGTKGLVISTEYYMGAMNGLGDGQARFGEQQPNLSTLSFLPIGNKNFEAAADPNATEIYGVETGGVIIRSGDNKYVATISSKGKKAFFVDGELGGGIMGATLTEATNDGDAKAKGVKQYCFYRKSDGSLWIQMIPD
jgi:hypothetical protein